MGSGCTFFGTKDVEGGIYPSPDYYKGKGQAKGAYQYKGQAKGAYQYKGVPKGKGHGKHSDTRDSTEKGAIAQGDDGKGGMLNATLVQDTAEVLPVDGLLDDVEDDELGDDQPEDGRVPPFFAEILSELETYVDKLGGLKHFKQKPFIERKVSKRDFATTYTDYEYVYLTVLGFAFLHSNNQEIVSKNNGQVFTRNPGVQILERVCGITMHAGRDGCDGNHLLRSAPALLVEAFQLCRADGRPGSCLHFFTHAFDRTGGPCLEGRYSLLAQYSEKKKRKSDPQAMNAPPWEDVSLQPIAKDASPEDILGEHLRVFVAECTWKWSKVRNISYEQAISLRFGDDAADSSDFAKYYNAATFQDTMIARRVATEGCLEQWESTTKSGEWLPYQPDVSDKISYARKQGLPNIRLKLGPRAWNYTLDFSRMVQINDTSGGEREVRCVKRAAEQRAGRVTLEELKEVSRKFIDLATLPEALDSGTVTQISGLHSHEKVTVEENKVQIAFPSNEDVISTEDELRSILCEAVE